jgi:hypothetical protein
MKKLLRQLLAATLLIGWLASAASALTVPERLVYDVSWSGVKAGTAVLEVSAQEGELLLVYTVHSSGWFDSFFHIDDRTESVLTRDSGAETYGLPRLYREKLTEGKTRNVKEARFDHANLKVETRDLLKKTEKTDPISPRTHDTLSSIYFMRSNELVQGRPANIDVFDCKRLWNAEVRLVRHEEIKTDVGKFKTLVVKTQLKAEGMKPRPDYMTVWLSDDQRRIPVKMTIKMKVGELNAVLVGGSYWP